MSDPIPVLVNAGGGNAKASGERLGAEIEAAFAEAGVPIALELLSGEAVVERAREFAGAPLVVVGGGDGTLGCAAGVLAGTQTALGILPLGTRNHLAAELGIPVDLPGAARVIADGQHRRIDLARVNGRAFVNNACVGFYPAMIRFRDAGGVPEGARWKKLAAVPAAIAALKRMRHHRLRLRVSGTDREVVTPMLFVGNNRYRLEPGHVGQRAALDDGQLSVFAIRSRHRVALLGFAARTRGPGARLRRRRRYAGAHRLGAQPRGVGGGRRRGRALGHAASLHRRAPSTDRDRARRLSAPDASPKPPA